MENTSNNEFFGGMFLGILIMAAFTILFFINEPTSIQSYEKLMPKTKLTTDGVKVDTLYIYTIK